MTWQTDWHSLSRRILGLREAGDRIFGSSNVYPPGFNTVVEALLVPQTKKVFADLVRFAERWRSQLPQGAAATLDDLLARCNGETLWDPKATSPTAEGWRVIGARTLAVLAIIRAEVAYALADGSQAEAISLTERSLRHLQWLIVADTDTARKWREAFKSETHCERLGATHLLQHGVWAFKADGGKQKTDLVLGELVEDEPGIRRAARALVLTEWKRVTTPADLDEAAKQGRKQARIYSGEALAGIELRSVRYVILVSEKRLRAHDDLVQDDITYRHWNIAVNPDLASARSGPASE